MKTEEEMNVGQKMTQGLSREKMAWGFGKVYFAIHGVNHTELLSLLPNGGIHAAFPKSDDVDSRPKAVVTLDQYDNVEFDPDATIEDLQQAIKILIMNYR